MNARPVRLRALTAVLGAAIALIATVTVIANSPADATERDHASVAHHGHGRPDTPRTRQQIALHDQMRKLWEDHITWTRLAIVTFADGSAGFGATAARLLQNQTDIGNAIKPYYGEEAGNALTELLNEHITIAVELLQAAKAGDTAAFEDANARWYANADDIADFLAAANPRWWPQDVMRAALRAHLDQTLAEAAHELAGDYAASVADYEVIHEHILVMADQLSSGIWRQFPSKFH